MSREPKIEESAMLVLSSEVELVDEVPRNDDEPLTREELKAARPRSVVPKLLFAFVLLGGAALAVHRWVWPRLASPAAPATASVAPSASSPAASALASARRIPDPPASVATVAANAAPPAASAPALASASASASPPAVHAAAPATVRPATQAKSKKAKLPR